MSSIPAFPFSFGLRTILPCARPCRRVACGKGFVRGLRNRIEHWRRSFLQLGYFDFASWRHGIRPALVSPALAAGVRATAVDVRRVLHRLALRAAIAAALRCQARTRRVLAFVRSSLSHLRPPAETISAGRIISSCYSMRHMSHRALTREEGRAHH